jgi:putative ABC transport system substrate-binding protein
MVLKKMNEISKLSNVAVILSKAEKDSILQAKIIKSSDSSLGFTSTLISVKDKVEKSQISGANAILVTTCSAGMMNIKDIIESGRNSRIPTAAMIGGGENDGVILTVAANPEEQGKELAGMVSKVLGGASPSQIPFKNPRKVEIILNLKEAAAIGIDIPANIKSSATKVIE